MAKQKKRTLTFTEEEILAFSMVVGTLIMRGELNEKTPERALDQAAEVFAKFGVVADIVASNRGTDKEDIKAEIFRGLEDRCLGAEFVIRTREMYGVYDVYPDGSEEKIS
ncbi:hypothetical protein [Pseudoteredinibacter isoporae]|uniref:hypothetical protein n=1 Tax=Pseudoteredinibacter isoporae TaxID=570281 RepID=UPI003106C781